MINSRYNRFKEAHFRYNNNGNYIFIGDFEAFNRQFRIYERIQNDILKINYIYCRSVNRSVVNFHSDL
jgi:hypothetical protein